MDMGPSVGTDGAGTLNPLCSPSAMVSREQAASPEKAAASGDVTQKAASLGDATKTIRHPKQLICQQQLPAPQTPLAQEHTKPT